MVNSPLDYFPSPANISQKILQRVKEEEDGDLLLIWTISVARAAMMMMMVLGRVTDYLARDEVTSQGEE